MSPANLSVNIRSRLTVVSSIPLEPIGQMHGLSPLDHVMGSHTGHIIFYYRNSPFPRTGRYGMDLDSFRVSLADLLYKYPKMTGRLIRDDDNGNWAVKCNDAGVRMIKASVGCTVDEWLRFADGSDEMNLTVWDDIVDEDPNTLSPFRIQINEFEGGGVAIGLSFTHLLADPTTAALFFKSWTDVQRGDPAGNRPPIFDLPTPHPQPHPFPSTTKFLQTKSKSPPKPSVKTATATFKFSHTTIKQQLQKITNESPNATPFDFLAAFFWLRIGNLKPKNSLSICIDYRKQLGVPIPEKFFGNALCFSEILWDFTGGDGLREAVDAIHRRVSEPKEEDFFGLIDWVESRKGLNGEYPEAVQMYGPELTCVSMEHLKEGEEMEALIYEARFSNGEKPVHVSCRYGNADGEGMIVVMPSAEGGFGRSVRVTLPAEQLDKLCDDRVVLDLDPTMILSGRA